MFVSDDGVSAADPTFNTGTEPNFKIKGPAI